MRRLLPLLLLLMTACSARRPTPETVERADELVGVWYEVKAGDTVASVAKAQGVPEADIVELNDLPDGATLTAGQTLFLYGIDELVRRRAPAKAKTQWGKEPPALGWPLEAGVVTSGFGPRWGRMHKGVDIAAEAGTHVLAAADGDVIYSDNGWRGYGNLVVLRHAGGYVTVYAHNRRNLVDEGEVVRQGAAIAEVGSTGHSTGPHCHFEVRIDGKPQDPLIYLPAR